MFFAFYTCREKFSMRHFDVKLLNFFVSTGGSILSQKQKIKYENYQKNLIIYNQNKSNNESNENNNKNIREKNKINNKIKNKTDENEHHNENDIETVKMKIGFGEYIFTIPLSIKSLCVVKLADFGTSAVGAVGLGDPITQQQVCPLSV